MRMRTPLKRSTAAALALGVALSSAAPAATATYYCKVDKDSTLTITKDESGAVTVDKDGTAEVDHIDDGKDDVIITSDADKMPSHSPSSTDTDVPNPVDATEDAPAGDEPDTGFATMDLTPEDFDKTEAPSSDEKESEEVPADSTSDVPDRTVTKTAYDTVIEYGDYDAFPNLQVTQPSMIALPGKAPESSDGDKEEKTCLSEASDTLTSGVSRAAAAVRDYVVKIINRQKSTEEKDNFLNITLDDVNIDASKTSKAAISVEGEGDVTLRLKGDNTLTSGSYHAGLEKNAETEWVAPDPAKPDEKRLAVKEGYGSLTITAADPKDDTSGKLTTTGGEFGAGIGGSSALHDTGNITIAGGTINANGGRYSAGIGGQGSWGGNGGNAANITISGGVITALGGYCGAGIGGGGTGTTGVGGSADITISGGVIEKATGSRGAGIGGGCGSSYTGTAAGGKADITITGGLIKKAYGSNGGAAIGGGGALGSKSGENSTKTATGGDARITISGGTIQEAVGSNTGAAIGGGGVLGSADNCSNSGGHADITITGGVIEKASSDNYGAGIGGGGSHAAGSNTGGIAVIRIGTGTAEDGTVTIPVIKNASSGAMGAGIGGGGALSDAASASGIGGNADITISGGIIENAEGGSNSVGIGIGTGNTSGGQATVAITGGTVSAVGKGSGAGRYTSTAINTGTEGTLTICNETGDLDLTVSAIRADNTLVSKGGAVPDEAIDLAENGFTAVVKRVLLAASKPYQQLHNAKYAQKYLEAHPDEVLDDDRLSDTEKTAHVWVLTQPTDEDGQPIYHYECKLCGFVKEIRHSHTSDSGTITTEPTCTAPGVRTFRCSVCGKVLGTEEVTPTGHTWTDWVPVPGDPSKESRACIHGDAEEFRSAVLPSDAGVSVIRTNLEVFDSHQFNIIRNVNLVTLTQVGRVLYIDAKEDTATLRGRLDDLSALLTEDIDTIVFSTTHCTSALHLGELTTLGSEDTIFALMHTDSLASLTVGSADCSALIH